jgi:tripartite-type tricarboxylate transporter receptor subunit TctC
MQVLFEPATVHSTADLKALPALRSLAGQATGTVQELCHAALSKSFGPPNHWVAQCDACYTGHLSLKAFQG